ncbi:glycoside hydrolase family 2 protein [Hyunsoonleella pacifica]|uniref:Beta-glucuronidase n=1 Tax=Hyunsoonleella pacifica TaxID=1080224 RepID=A0A4Q9FIU4_9FLAO|nr:glycoside hydrolase family 2 TIM barrel-domain containing protein [Hyunsoonleella pacifica]TBN13069.1 beta-glucuronidase [Hyunsoonleella pacifica]GGD27395.1 beta-glucuronidase [Hyunsoonleella pacifica]
MKQIINSLLFLITIYTYANEPLLQNSYLRNGQSLNGRWHYIVDVYETGYYNYRMEPHDGTENPGSSAYFLNKKPKNKMDRVEYDFDATPTMVVPGDWNSQKEKLFYYEGTVWYKKSFNVENYDANKRYYVHFGAVNYRADVYLNGKKLGVHVGGFTPFNFEMTHLLKEKGNFLIIKVDNKRAADEVPTLSTDWWNYGGITRDVTVYELDQMFIEDYKIQLTKNNNKEVSGYIQLNGKNKGAQKVNLTIPELKINKTFTTDVNGFVQVKFPVKRVKYWSDTNPKLYEVNIAIAKDKVTDKIGLRTIETKGKAILLNGEKIFLKGISIHEENVMRGGRAWSIEDAKVLLGWAKELGCNYVRLAHYPHNENMIRVAEQMGILVWEEIPVYWTIQWTNSETYKKAETQLTELISRDKNRACSIIWSMANETPTSKERLTFLTNLATTARKLDDTRLISAALEDHGKKENKNIMIVEDEFAKVVDVLSFNQYYGWYGGKIDNIKNIRWNIDIDKPVIISEFGAGALQGYYADKMTRWSEEFQELLYEETLPTLVKISGISGITPWTLVDFRSPRRTLIPYQDGWNRKGLISETGNKKKAFYTLQKFYKDIN